MISLDIVRLAVKLIDYKRGEGQINSTEVNILFGVFILHCVLSMRLSMY